MNITPEIPKINAKLLDACKLALKSFEENWAIDWNEIAEAIDEAEKALITQ